MDNKFNYKCEKSNKTFNDNLSTLGLDAKKLVATLLLTTNCAVNVLAAQIDDPTTINRIQQYSKNISNIEETAKTKNEIVTRVNEYVNGSIKYKSDQANYGQKDYYASPIETIQKKAGDCEDYAMLKFNILVQEFGMDPNKFSFMYGYAGKNKEPHMVLSYKENGQDYILDNRSNKIVRLDKKDDFQKLFEVEDNKVKVGNQKPQELKEDSKYVKLTEISLPKNLSTKVHDQDIQVASNDIRSIY